TGSAAAMGTLGRDAHTLEAVIVPKGFRPTPIAAAEERHDALVVVDAVLRGDQLVVPPVVLDQLAAAPAELPQVRIGRVEDRRELGFGFEEPLAADRIGELEPPPVPAGIGEHEPPEVRDRNGKRGARVAVGPERLASNRKTGIELRAGL